MAKRKRAKRETRVPAKLALFLLALMTAFWIGTSEYPKLFLDQLLPFKLLAVFGAGMLYASFLTAPLSVAFLVVLAGYVNPWQMALFGGLGAMTTDVLIIRTLRRLFGLAQQVSSSRIFRQAEKVFRALHLDFLALVAGAVIVASPLPDELGLLLIGASRLSSVQLVLLTFCLNSLGIWAIAYFAGKAFT